MEAERPTFNNTLTLDDLKKVLGLGDVAEPSKLVGKPASNSASLWDGWLPPWTVQKQETPATQSGPSSRKGFRETWRQSSSYDVYGKKLFAKEGGLRYDLFTGEKAPSQPLDKLTIGQVMALQKQRKDTAAGAYQFTLNTLRDTMKEAGLTEADKFDSKTQYKLFETFTRKNEEHAKQVLGKEKLNDAERYSLHFLGRFGGVKFLKLLEDNPNANFSTEFRGAFARNRDLIDRVGGNRATVSDVFRELAKRMN